MDQVIGIHENGLHYIEHDGHKRILACLPNKKDYSHIKLFSAGITIPRSQWKEFDHDDSDLPLLDQDGHGSCVGHGSCTVFQHAWNRAYPNNNQRFSPNFLYGLVNGGSDNGASVGDAIDALVKTGICLESTVPEGNIIFERQFPKAAYTEASRFKAEEWSRVQTFDQIVTAILLDRMVSIGINCGRNFNPNSQGVLPQSAGSSGGHCLAAGRGLKFINGQWYPKVRNSWGNWGVKGNCWMPESYFNGNDDHFVADQPAQDPEDK
jgi:hypothetical protein